MESEKMGWIGWREKIKMESLTKKLETRNMGWIGWRDSLTREKSLWVPPLDGSNQQHPTNPTL